MIDLIKINEPPSLQRKLRALCEECSDIFDIKPEKLIPYISENRSKTIVYTSVLFNTFNTITSGSTYSALVSSGITNIRGVLLIPFISSNTNGTS